MSACVYAFAGALIREVGPGAHVGVHNAKFNVQSTRARALKHGVNPKDITAEFLKKVEEAGRLELRSYLNEMSIDSTLTDRAAKVPSTSIHLLTRAELTRYGVITRNEPSNEVITRNAVPSRIITGDEVRHEIVAGSEVQSAWSVDYQGTPVKIATYKTFTRPSAKDGGEYRTTLRVLCFTNYGLVLEIERELAAGERGHEPTVRIISDGAEIWVSDKATRTSEKYDFRTLRVPAASVFPKKSLRYSETYTSGDWSGKSYERDVSLTGFEAGLWKVFSHCPLSAQVFSLPKSN